MTTRRQLIAAAVAAPICLVRVAQAVPTTRAAAADELVQFLLQTPRAALLEDLVSRIRTGLRPEELLKALCIASCREVSPYPDVGYKYHAVMMLQSVHLSMAGLTDEDVWLPLLWTADYFKAASAQEDRVANWSLPSALPGGGDARLSDLVHALERWDREAADSLTGALVEAGHTHDVLQTLLHHSARDFRAIGHKTIAAANAHRLCSVFGRSVASPLARSLALAVQNLEGDHDPARHEQAADADWKRVPDWSRSVPADWRNRPDDSSAARALLQELRTGTSQQVVGAAVELLQHHVTPQALWERMMEFAAELILRRNDIIAVHANTTINALHYAYLVSEADATRQALLLQAAAFMARFRMLMDAQRSLDDRRIDEIDPIEVSSVDEVFATLGRDRHRAVKQALGWLEQGHDPAPLVQRARWHATLKNTGTHDIKLTEAMIENFAWMRGPSRNAVLAASLMYANADDAPDDGLVARARERLARA